MVWHSFLALLLSLVLAQTHDSLALGAWHDSVLTGYESIEHGLVVNHEGMLTMLELWSNYEHWRLCTLTGLPQVNAMELEKFKDMQHTHCERVVNILKKKWFPSVLDIFRNEGRDEDVNPALLSAVSTLMFNQLRNLLKVSIDQFVQFFEGFFEEMAEEATVPEDEKLHSRDVGHRPLFVVKMLVEAESYRFSPSLPSLLKTVLGTIDHFVQMLNTVPRVEAELGKTTGAPRLLTIASADEDIVLIAKERLENIVKNNYMATEQMLETYMPFQSLLTVETEQKVSEFISEVGASKALGDVTSEINKYAKSKLEVEKRSESEVRFNLFTIACGAVKTKLALRADEFSDKLRMSVKGQFVSKGQELCSRYMEIFVRLGQNPTTEEEMVALETFLGESATMLLKLNGELNEARKSLRFLTEQAVGFEADQLQIIGDTWCWPSKIKPKVDECNKRLKAERNRAEEELNMKKDRFVEELDEYVRQAEQCKEWGEIERVTENCSALTTLQAKIAEAKERAEFMNGEEELLGQPLSIFEQLEAVPKMLAPFIRLWMTAQDFGKNSYMWLNGPMSAIDPESLEKEVGEIRRENIKDVKSFESDDSGNMRAPLKVAEKLKEQIEDFRQKMPLIGCICNKGMRERHWVGVSDLIGYQFCPNETTTLNSMLGMKLEKHLDALDEISGVASKEYSLEKALDKMFIEWQPLEFMLKEYRDTGTCIMAGSEEVQALLDDHIVKSQTMQGSPAIKPFEDRAKAWSAKLVLIQDLIDIWLKVQGVWQYLEPIFGSEDIMRQMPEEGKLFKKQDGMWRDNVKSVLKDVKVLSVADIPGLVESYREQNEILEVVQKGLNDYLEMKRLYFPRFFFLSNDELLEILSETKDPTRVQPHLGKCFEGIGKLAFEANNAITGMYSAEGEKITFGGETIQPSSMVEEWLVEVETFMFKSVERVGKESAADYARSDRVDWVQKWPGQIIILVGQMDWTSCLDTILEEKGNAGLKEYHAKTIEDVNGLVGLVRGDIPKLVRKAVSPLVVIDVHARDVVDFMFQSGVNTPNDFDWLSQLRYYVHPEEGFQVKMISTTLPYGCEYLGLQGRLVVTPLTDRCYRTLMGALQLDLGGAPEGPAGTGKTETTKDLGKSVARQCIVMNCSDGLDYLAMAKFFKGLAASGAWACFDEFNRIDLEVLSVVAQQILTIIRGKVAKVTEFDFEGSHLPLKWTCNSFITMNPGYAGRSELPDNLKALFRTVAMMVPDCTCRARAHSLRSRRWASRLYLACPHAAEPHGLVPYTKHSPLTLSEPLCLRARRRDDRRGHAALLRLPRGAAVCAQDRADVQAVLRAALVAGPLRLRHASGDGRASCGGQPQAHVRRLRREHSHAPLNH
jgi:dynein heavy chain